MELWIRTQTGQSLVKINNVSITKQTEGRYIIDCDNWILGRYKSEERALQILDEIQNILQPRVIYHQPEINYDDMIHSLSESIMIQSKQKVEMELKEAGQVVYQMPKE